MYCVFCCSYCRCKTVSKRISQRLLIPLPICYCILRLRIFRIIASCMQEKNKKELQFLVTLLFWGWAQLGLNQRPPDYESGATNQLSYGPWKLPTMPTIFCDGKYSKNCRYYNAKRLSDLNFYFNSAWKFEFHQSIDRFRGRAIDIEQSAERV